MTSLVNKHQKDNKFIGKAGGKQTTHKLLMVMKICNIPLEGYLRISNKTTYVEKKLHMHLSFDQPSSLLGTYL